MVLSNFIIPISDSIKLAYPETREVGIVTILKIWLVKAKERIKLKESRMKVQLFIKQS